MSNTALHNLQNPFLKNNPFRPPQKFYSQDKIISTPIQQQFGFHSHMRYQPSFSPSIKVGAFRGVPSHGHDSSQHYFDQQFSISKFTLPSKDRNIAKRCMNVKQNPFLRKNLVPLDLQDPLPYISPSQMNEKHQKLFSSVAKNKPQRENQELMINIISSGVNPRQDAYCNKQNDQSGPSRPRESLRQEKQSSRKLEIPEENKPKYLTSELKIRLKSQTCIEAEAVSNEKSRREASMGRSLREEGVPSQITVLGRNFYFQEVEYRS